MYLLLTDESNLEPSKEAEFFVIGGLFLPMETLKPLHDGISEIRAAGGYRPKDELKFGSRSRPRHVSVEASNRAKSGVVALCQRLGCRFIAYAILHKIATRKQERVLWGLDAVLAAFDHFLYATSETGVVLCDPLPCANASHYLTARFTEGIVYEDQGAWRELYKRIHIFGTTGSQMSFASSAVDIVLGAFRYALNDRVRGGQFMKAVAPLLWRGPEDKPGEISEHGLILRPLVDKVTVRAYRAKYAVLRTYVDAALPKSDSLKDCH